jgi:integrase
VPLEQDEDTPVCIGDKGSWLPPSRITHWWSGAGKGKGFRDEIGFPGLMMHELRHTQATQLLGEGVDVKTVQTRMGHAKASHTLDLYAHAIPTNDQNAADVMGGLTRGASRRGATLADRHKPKRRGKTTGEERRARREARRAMLPA